MKQKLVLVAALFFGILAFLLTFYQIKYEKEKIQGLAKTVVFVKVKSDIAEGEKITEANTDGEKVMRSANYRGKEVEWADRERIVGRKVNRFLRKGEVLMWYDIELEGKTGREGLATMIPEHMRAVSINVDATSSVSNLIRPNHHVDVLGTFKFPEMRADRSLDTITLTLLQCVTVIATGSDTSESLNTSNKRGYSTITLALTPKESEIIIFASQKGKLTLTLRNYEDTEIIKNLPSLNFKYLEDNMGELNIEREKFLKEGSGALRRNSKTK